MRSSAVDSSTAETDDGRLIDDDPKSRAGIRELMEQMGHSSTRAAIIYLHVTRERDRRIAAANLCTGCASDGESRTVAA